MTLLEHFSSYLDFYLFGSFPQGEPGGLLLNIIIAILSFSLSFIFGMMLGYSRLSSRLYVKLPCIAYIELVRATPLIILIFLFYYVIPFVFGVYISVFWSVILAMSIYSAAYQAEIVRSGIIAVSRNQLDIALSTGLPRYKAMAYVILPQAFRMMIPSFLSFFVTLFKDTSTVLIIGVIELTQAGMIVSRYQPENISFAYLIVAIGFFVVTNSLLHIVGKLEKRFGVFDFLSYRPDVSRDEFMLFPRYSLQSTPLAARKKEKKKPTKYAMLIDIQKCIGCYACRVTCKAEYNLPYGTARCNVETFQSGQYPDLKKFFLPRICNQCEKPPCIDACESKDALFKTPEGVVILNESRCPTDFECRKCYEMCPYDAIDIDPFKKLPVKCDFCYERIQRGEKPVCVQSCMGKAIIFGDMNDEQSELSKMLRRYHVRVLNPEYETYPLVFYLISQSDSKFIPLRRYDPLTNRPSAQVPVKDYATARSDSVSDIRYTVDSMCPSECGIAVRVENGIATKIYGNPHSLINNGTLCAKGAVGLQLTYSPYRIKRPLMRTGERGEDKWREISWEEASDYVARKLIEIKRKYGPESVFFDGGDMTDTIAYERLFRAFGTPHIYHHGSVCDPNRQWGQRLMLGDARPLPDVQRPLLLRGKDGSLSLKTAHDAKLIINIGTNPFVATRFNYMSNGIPGAKRENNCKYIVVDPSHTNSAAHADMWIPIRPGTDAHLLAAMLYYIIKNDSRTTVTKKYIDHEFIRKYTTGWTTFKEEFMSYSRKVDPSNGLNYFTPAWAAEKTGIPKKQIIYLANLFGITKPASIEIGMHGTAHHTNGDVTSILMVTLCLITGNMDRPGGLVFISSQKPQHGLTTSGLDFLDRRTSRIVNGRNVEGRLAELHKDHYGDYPTAWRGVLTDLPRRVHEGITLKYGPFKGLTYPVKALITRAGNPVITAGNTGDWIDAFTAKDRHGNYKIELSVYIDTHVTVTGRYADIVFPESGFLERMGLSNVFTMSPEIALKDQVIKPLYESKTPYEFMMVMAEALMRNGDSDIMKRDFTSRYASEEEFINEQLSDTPGFYNVGEPLPYPDLPEGCLILGTPDNPRAVLNNKVIKEGELLTAEWLRKNNGVAVWPASYYRYKNSDGNPSGVYPRTGSGKFEFEFSMIKQINKKFGTDFPTTFYWSESRWNPKNTAYEEIKRQYPFQLISGRVHHTMTITVVCPSLAETETECMVPLNEDISYTLPASDHQPNTHGIPVNEEIIFRAGSVSIPVFAVNRSDGEMIGIKSGDIIILENPLGKKIRGKAILTDEIMPGVIKTAFGPGGQRASGLGFYNSTCDYTPNINELHDTDNFNTLTGTPGFGDIMVKVTKQFNI
jgi:His/Glu/Gln/Arg/opine family amino acid ABC transporter permease subunit